MIKDFLFLRLIDVTEVAKLCLNTYLSKKKGKCIKR